MSDKFIKETVTSVVGKQAAEIVDFLNSKKYVNEFLIAKKMDITVNQVRNILYKLSDNGLVSSTRKKDKRKGWYTYFWKVEGLKCLEYLKRMFIKRIEQVNYYIKSRETKNFYICERCNIEFNEETALLYDFTCNECGGIFTMKDNTRVINDFNRTLDKLKKRLKLVEEEIKKETEILEKKRMKEIAKEEKEKKKKREDKRKARILEKKKAAGELITKSSASKKKKVKSKIKKKKTTAKKSSKLIKKKPVKKKKAVKAKSKKKTQKKKVSKIKTKKKEKKKVAKKK